MKTPTNKAESMGEVELTKAKRSMLELAARSPTGNPWPLIGMRQRAGGGKARMFAEMQADGLFDRSNCITPTGRAILKENGDG